MANLGESAKKNFEHAYPQYPQYPLYTVFSRTTCSIARARSLSRSQIENGGPIRNPRPGSVMEWKVMRQESKLHLTLPLLALL